MNPVLDVQNVSVHYTGKQILKNISFSVHPGEFVAVIGPNGCGKTTLIKTIIRALAPSKGQICVMGHLLNALTTRELARFLAVVLQTIQPAAMTVRDYVLLGRLPFFKRYQFFETRHDVAIAEKYMHLTGVAGLADARVNEISGGELQLASIARALTQEPSLLILDEPTSHLDITHQARILELITTLKNELSLTILMVLHDLNLAAEYSDRLVLLDKHTGQVFKTGRPETVLTQETIKAVYHTRVEISLNPLSHKPWIFLVSQQSNKRNPEIIKSLEAGKTAD